MLLGAQGLCSPCASNEHKANYTQAGRAQKKGHKGSPKHFHQPGHFEGGAKNRLCLWLVILDMAGAVDSGKPSKHYGEDGGMNDIIPTSAPSLSVTTSIGRMGYRILEISAKDIGRIIGMTKLEVLQGAGINNKNQWVRGYYPVGISVMDSVHMVNGQGKLAILNYWNEAIHKYVPRNKRELLYIKSVEQDLMACALRLLIDLNGDDFDDEASRLESEEAYAADFLEKSHPDYQSQCFFNEMLKRMKLAGPCRRSEIGFVYVIEYANSVVKIGKTQKPKERLASLSTVSSSPILRVFVSCESKHYSVIERRSHKYYDEERLHGEMFTVPFEDAVNFIAAAVAAMNEKDAGKATA
jgi:hypothetical protein